MLQVPGPGSVDKFNRECVLMETDFSFTGRKVARALERVGQQRPLPQVITVDNGSEFAGKDLGSCPAFQWSICL